jgi:hypothetical protein
VLPSANGHLAGPPIQVKILQDQAVKPVVRAAVGHHGDVAVAEDPRERDQAAGFGKCAKARPLPGTSRK